MDDMCETIRTIGDDFEQGRPVSEDTVRHMLNQLIADCNQIVDGNFRLGKKVD